MTLIQRNIGIVGLLILLCVFISVILTSTIEDDENKKQVENYIFNNCKTEITYKIKDINITNSEKISNVNVIDKIIITENYNVIKFEAIRLPTTKETLLTKLIIIDCK